MSFQLSGKHLLIVDDKPTNLKVLATTLTEAGFDVAVATNGLMALEQVAEDPPQLIILDVLMPEMDGFETCRRLKAHPGTQEIPVIFMTALADTVDKVRGFSLGAVDYITKPFETEEVLARVKTHLNLRFLTKTLEEKNQELSLALERLNRTQEQLIAQEKLATIGSLTTGIVHELRNPLNFVKNYAEGSLELSEDLQEQINQIAAQVSADPLNYIQELIAELRENAATIARHAKRAENVIRDMLLQAHADDTQFQPTDINALLEQAVQLTYKSKYSQNINLRIQITKNYDYSIGLVRIISAQLSRAFINLLDNAFYALQKKHQDLAETSPPFTPQISLKTKQLEESIQIRIRDNGSGIDPAIQKDIFRAFFSTKPTDQGTGLGLYLTQDIIVNKHRGSLDLISDLGEYTEFIIEIPKLP